MIRKHLCWLLGHKYEYRYRYMSAKNMKYATVRFFRCTICGKVKRLKEEYTL